MTMLAPRSGPGEKESPGREKGEYMKVTITAPFARVQVEVNAGEAAQLIHMALDPTVFT